MRVHSQPHPLAGKTVQVFPKGKHLPAQDGRGVIDGHAYRVEDYWDRIVGMSWTLSVDNQAARAYAIRNSADNLPLDDEVLYGKIGSLGYLIHVSELE